MRFSLTFILLACTLLVMAQSNKISEEEKSRLENQFKALKTYYINDDGLVVYQKQASDTNGNNTKERQETKTKSEKKAQTTQPVVDKQPATKNNSQISNQQSNFVINKRPTDPNTITTNKIEQISKTPISNQDQTPIINKTAAKTTAKSTKTEIQSTTKVEQTPIKEKENTKSDKSTPITSVNNTTKTKVTPTQEESNLKNNVAGNKETGAKKAGSYPYRKLELSNSPLKYKDMEEAAMAVDNLLDKLKKEQAQDTNKRPGSMSTKIARGVGKSTFRKETISDSETIDNMGMRNTYEIINNDNNSGESQNYDYESYDDNEDLDVDVPTYYINGYEVDRSEVDKLKKRDIISRQVRIRNTISGNPAGEVWLEVKESKL